MMSVGARYGEFVRTLREVEGGAPHDLPAILDGYAAAELRRLVTLRDRRRLGAFFTPHEMADRLVEPLADLRGSVHIADLSCGAGDLLLAALRRLAPAVRAQSAQVSLLGVDCIPEFVEAASIRLRLLSQSLEVPALIATHTGDGMRHPVPERCTAVVLNPPFAATEAPSDCSWANGVVNGASLFLDEVLDACADGTHVYTILPEVLRSGSRYVRWRRAVDARLEVTSTESLGRFDDFADVDVFALRGVKRTTGLVRETGEWIAVPSGRTVQDFFSVSVGPVVQYREPNRGTWHPFLAARDFPAWKTVETAPRKRRFRGRLFEPPFVIIPRTSRPGESARARGAVVRIDEAVAVENHLLIASPHDGSAATCRELLEVLRRTSTTGWLDDVMRCRHLTVGVVGQIPWDVA